MKLESKQWRSSRWTPGKIHRFLLHVRKHTIFACEQFLRPHEGRLLAAEIRAEESGRQSKAELAAMGIKTLGDK